MIRIYHVNQNEYWAANSLQEAITCSSKESDVPESEVAEGAYEVADEALDTLIIRDEDKPGWESTFRKELERMHLSGAEIPCLFCVTEY